ncbi:MAG: hypothetical protein LBB81_08025 [Treponema sp.]|nr:hypothetical protein [Treponema sp.]
MKKKPRFFCDNCGQEVDNRVKACPNCGRYFASVRCPKCGFTGGDKLFNHGCPSCGYSSLPAKSSPAQAPGIPRLSKKREPKGFLFYIILLISILTVGLLSWLITR